MSCRDATPQHSRMYEHDRTRPTGCSIISIFLSSLFCCLLVQAQDHRPNAAPSQLSQQNMSLVAASATEIKAVLLKDAGLMVELKRLVAKDATDHGQLISESDLTDSAIFDRLESDILFRSHATLLLQKYGYLVPQVNPESPLAKQQELIMQERVKSLAQEEEEERAEARSARQQELQDLQKARALI